MNFTSKRVTFTYVLVDFTIDLVDFTFRWRGPIRPEDVFPVCPARYERLRAPYG